VDADCLAEELLTSVRFFFVLFRFSIAIVLRERWLERAPP